MCSTSITPIRFIKMSTARSAVLNRVLVPCRTSNAELALLTRTIDGTLFEVGANNIVLNGQRNSRSGDFRGEEWAGAGFSPDGRWLFANIQTPGITFAITGPWNDGGL